MARYYGDARIVYSGNVELARQYVSEARKYLGALDRDNTTDSASRHVTNSDGIRFFVANYMGQRQIEIWAPGGEEKEGAGTVLGFLLSPRTLVGPQDYSTSPHVLLEPGKSPGTNWKSYFCLPSSTHPEPSYPYDVKTLNKILVSLNTNALESNANPVRTNAALSFWTTTKQDLFLQYYMLPSYTNSIDAGVIIHNAKIIFDVYADHPDTATSFVDIAACGAKRAATGVTVIVASYVSASYAGPCYLKVHAIDLVPTAEGRAAIAEYVGLVDNANSYAPEFQRQDPIRELYSIPLSKSPNQVWFCMSVNGSCSELRGIITENPGGADTLREYVVDLTDLDNITHTVVREWAPIIGDWQDLYTGHIGDCPVYGEALLADPGAAFRFRTYIENPSATSPLNTYVRTGTVWLTGTGDIPGNNRIPHLANIGLGCGADGDIFDYNVVYAFTNDVYTG